MLDKNLTKKPEVKFNGNAKNIEMSRYIDLDLYHAIERSHAFYEEMITSIKENIKKYSDPKTKQVKLLELGAGTGLLTQELTTIENLEIDAFDLDEECVKILKEYVKNPKCNQFVENAVTYCKPSYYDIVVSAFAHDHINYDKKTEFSKNIASNLRPGGIYIMGGEILPYYSDEATRKKSLHTYHSYIINRALEEGHYELAQLEINALKSGVFKIGDFKRHEKEFEAEMESSGLKLLEKLKMGPLDIDNIGGVFVYVYQKPLN